MGKWYRAKETDNSYGYGTQLEKGNHPSPQQLQIGKREPYKEKSPTEGEKEKGEKNITSTLTLYV